MNLLKSTFDSISDISIKGNELKGLKLRKFSNKVWVCKNGNNYPVIVLKSSQKFSNSKISDRSYDLLEIFHHQNREIKSGKKKEKIYCSIIVCNSKDIEIQTLFLDVLLPIINKLEFPLNPKVLNILSEKLIQLFKNIKNPPLKSVQGLWAELFLISESKDKKEMINCWHDDKNDRYDFKSKSNFIEVKSTLSDERKHVFSLSQTKLKINEIVLIASLMLEKDENGISVEDLISEINKELKNNIDLKEELIFQVRSTLGSKWNESRKVCFAKESAKLNLKFYDLKDIPKLDHSVEKIKGVSQVKFTSNLDVCKEINSNKFKKKSKLFKSVF